MKKNKRLRNLLVIGPPLALILIGIGIYITVIKLISPDLKTISAIPNQPVQESTASATPNSTASATPINPISTKVTPASNENLITWQSEADDGINTWRLDPVSAAEQLAGGYGFLPGDQLTLVQNDSGATQPSGSASLLAMHGGDAYLITMHQPKKQGDSGIWVIKSIERQS